MKVEVNIILFIVRHSVRIIHHFSTVFLFSFLHSFSICWAVLGSVDIFNPWQESGGYGTRFVPLLKGLSLEI